MQRHHIYVLRIEKDGLPAEAVVTFLFNNKEPSQERLKRKIGRYFKEHAEETAERLKQVFLVDDEGTLVAKKPCECNDGYDTASDSDVSNRSESFLDEWDRLVLSSGLKKNFHIFPDDWLSRVPEVLEILENKKKLIKLWLEQQEDVYKIYDICMQSWCTKSDSPFIPSVEYLTNLIYVLK